MIHHSALSRKRLRSMKILDKRSCYVTALQDQLSTKDHFDRFGKVLSFRVLKDTDPKQLYVRYTDEASAVDAVAWCRQNPSAYADAKHGFNRYCSKFIHGKQCANEACENRHSWAETKDILTFLERVPTQSAASGTHTTALGLPPKVPALGPKPQRVEYQRVISLQDRIIDDLLREINDLKRVNHSLKRDAAQLQSHGPYGVVDALVQSRMLDSCSPVSCDGSVEELGF